MTNPKMNSRQLAEEIWKSVENAHTEIYKDAGDLEPEDREGLIQEIEGLLERHGDIPPDAALEAEREKNEREGKGW